MKCHYSDVRFENRFQIFKYFQILIYNHTAKVISWIRVFSKKYIVILPNHKLFRFYVT
jgi:hypothetical protein